MVRFAVILIAASLFAAILAAPPAHAQSAASGDTVESDPGDASFQLTEEKLNAFVAVAARIGRMKRVWEPRIKRAKTQSEATKYQDAAIKQMLALIEGAPGISVDEYMGIAQAAQTDEALARVIADMIEEAGGR
jgi:Domain of unknown function (DUF4168)